MAYVQHSTANPLGKRPWKFATSNNGLSFYEGSAFVIPTSTTGNPLNQPAYNFAGAAGATALSPVNSMHPRARRHQARRRARTALGKYIGSSFVIPPTQQVSGPPPWQGGLGDYAVDPATMPPAPAGMQYDANYNLVPIPPPSPLVPIGLLGAAGFAAWWFFLRKPKRVSLPVAA
jgi:hypothetical protein